MTKEKFTSINILLDKSSSMAPLADETIHSFNSFLREQKALPEEAVFSLSMFSHEYQMVADCIPLKDALELTEETYSPIGSTALLDALGRMINATGMKLSQMKEGERPSKVIFLIMTDGEENASKEYAHAKIMEMINHQKDKYNWQFIYIGANQDAIQGGASLGIGKNASYNYVPSAQGTHKLYSSISASVRNFRLSDTNDLFQMNPDDLKVDTTQVGLGNADIKTSK